MVASVLGLVVLVVDNRGGEDLTIVVVGYIVAGLVPISWFKCCTTSKNSYESLSMVDCGPTIGLDSKGGSVRPRLNVKVLEG